MSAIRFESALSNFLAIRLYGKRGSSKESSTVVRESDDYKYTNIKRFASLFLGFQSILDVSHNRSALYSAFRPAPAVQESCDSHDTRVRTIAPNRALFRRPAYGAVKAALGSGAKRPSVPKRRARSPPQTANPRQKQNGAPKRRQPRYGNAPSDARHTSDTRHHRRRPCSQ